MATTTNYGWDTPDDTDLVKDGAAAIRTLGSSVDTTTKALNPSTTLGDIEYRSATANTNTRLALGTAGQILTVNSGATAPEWAAPASGGGMTLLSTTTLSGASTTISSISQSYKDLEIVISGVTTTSNQSAFRIAPNGSTSISDFAMVRNIAGTGASAVGSTAGYIDSYSAVQFNNSSNAFVLRIYNYANATYNKAFDWNGYFTNSDPVKFSFSSGGGINTASAISSLTISPSANSFTAGQVLVYGVN
jgi:hypothetical protein